MAALSVVGDSQERNAQYKAQIAQNKAIREANLENTTRTGFAVGLLNVQRGERIRQLAQRRADLGQAELMELSSTGNNAAASGTVGASVDAVQTDIALQFNRARGQIQIENEIEAQNYNTALYELFQGGRDKLIDEVEPTGAKDAAIVGKAVISAVGTYYGDKMSLGLGKQQQGVQRASTQSGAAISFRS
jgi:hypothetical protein